MSWTLNDFYNIYIPTRYPDLSQYVTEALNCEVTKLYESLTNLNDYLNKYHNINIWSLYLLFSKDKFTSILNHYLLEEETILETFLTSEVVVIELENKLIDYYKCGVVDVKEKYNNSQVTGWDIIFGKFLLKNDDYCKILYYSSSCADRHSLETSLPIFPDIQSAMNYCVNKEFNSFYKEMDGFLKHNNAW